MENFFTVLYILIYTFVIVLTYERYMGVFFQKRRTSLPVVIGSYSLLYVFLSLEVFFNPIFAFVAIFAFLAISFNYEASTAKRLVATVCSYLCIQMIQGLFMVFAGAFPNGFEHLDSGTVALLFLASSVLNYVIASFFRKFKSIKNSKMSMPASWISFLLIPIFSITIMVMQLQFATYLPQFVVAIISVMAFVIIVLAFYFQNAISKAYEDKLKSALHTQEKEYYFSQCQLMQESAEQVKSIRHDMKLHLSTVKGFSSKIKADEITDYVSGLLGDIGESEVYSDTGNIAFDSIINFKLKNAVDDDIKLDINVLVPPSINIEVADVVTILGNLLDNALDAVAKVEDKRIKLNVKLNKGNLVIKTENTFNGEVKYAKGKDGAERIITTRKVAGEHGHGLNNIRKSVEKYDGHVDISHDGNIFSVSVLLYV